MKISAVQARSELWRRGILRWKLHETQKEIYDKFYKSPEGMFVILSARRTGKSFLLCTLAVEHAIKIPDAEIKYAAPSQKQVKRIIVPIFKKLFSDCPEDFKPTWHAQEQIYRFPNGSTITIAGMDAGRADDLRGTDAHLGIIDEAGFSRSLYVKDLVDSILTPMTLLTGGKIVIASTPSPTPRHQFEKYYLLAKSKGAAIKKTIYDNPMLSKHAIEKFMRQIGGPESTEWKREALAEFVIDEELIVIPEFTEERQKEIITDKYKRPEYFDYYVGMDVGLKDATGIVIGYWDFKEARVVIEGEALLHGVEEVRTDIIADTIMSLESELYGRQRPIFRVSDTELLLLNDLDSLHNIKFFPVSKKDSKEAGVNELRILVKQNKIRIHPRCKNLIEQLESCIWTKNKDKFARTVDFYHFDLVDALIYLIRSIRKSKNPYPQVRYSSATQFFYHQPSQSSVTGQVLERAFKIDRFLKGDTNNGKG